MSAFQQTARYIIVLVVGLLLAAFLQANIESASDKQHSFVETASDDKNLAIPATPEWNTYRNARLGYQSQYPSNWIIEEVSSPETDARLRTFQTSFADRNELVQFSIYSSQSWGGSYHWPDDAIISTSPIVLDGTQKEKVIVKYPSGRLRVVILDIQNDDFKHWIDVFFQSPPTPEDLNMLERFRGSFHIL